ncbi:PtsN: predicted nitrogen regulatory protein (enzyme IIA-NTR) [Desulfosarcina variabilis str. Montpellier]|uniref:PTS sugar transporter subunit IIA n=1 Tax=Desulfosarcina variabilis TaxID=2300 RepID=UPI003AFA56B3
MKLSMEMIAGALDLPVSTLKRWIRQGRIPVQRSGADGLFSPMALEKWAATHNLSFTLNNNDQAKTNISPPPSQDSLVSAMKRGDVHYQMSGNDPDSVLRAAVDHIAFLSSGSKQELFQKLMAREQLASTGIGNGIAIPHPREPLSDPPDAPVITTCFLEKAIDYHAIDDRLVFVLFILISPTVKLHLHMLSRLSYCIRDQTFVDFLTTHPEAADLYSHVSVFEKQLDDL